MADAPQQVRYCSRCGQVAWEKRRNRWAPVEHVCIAPEAEGIGVEGAD